MIEQIQASAGKPVPLEILRAGKPLTIKVTPAKRAHPTTINVTGNRNIHYRLVAPQLGVETTPESNNRSSNVYTRHLTRFNTNNSTAQARSTCNCICEGAQAKPDDSTARIEAQLTEMSSKLDEFARSSTASRKPSRSKQRVSEGSETHPPFPQRS